MLLDPKEAVLTASLPRRMGILRASAHRAIAAMRIEVFNRSRLNPMLLSACNAA